MKLRTKTRKQYHEIIFAKMSICAKKWTKFCASVASLMQTEQIVGVMLKLWNLVQIYTSMRD